MDRNMREWLKALPESKKSFPILSFPCVSLLGCSVTQVLLRALACNATATATCQAVTV